MVDGCQHDAREQSSSVAIDDSQSPFTIIIHWHEKWSSLTAVSGNSGGVVTVMM
jgi:hypothetical protein